MICLNIGSHNVKLEGFLNIDILDLPGVDIVSDITVTPWKFLWKKKKVIEQLTGLEVELTNALEEVGNGSIDEILMVEVLEHLSFHDTDRVLKEIYRVLKPGGKIHIQVPDCGSMMKMYVNQEICACVPHKPTKERPAKSDKNCFACGGKGRVNPMRWLMAFCGAQKYGVPDIHKNIFTAERLDDALSNAGFDRIEFKEDPLGWKLKVNCTK